MNVSNAIPAIYHVVTIRGDDSEPEPQGIPIPARIEPETDLDPQVHAVEIEPGMACMTVQGHPVRVVKTHMDTETPYANVYVIANPRLKGPMFLNELTPIPTRVSVGDTVTLHVGGKSFPVYAEVAEVNGDYARFDLPLWGESHWLHTSQVLSVRPRCMRRK